MRRVLSGQQQIAQKRAVLTFWRRALFADSATMTSHTMGGGLDLRGVGEPSPRPGWSDRYALLPATEVRVACPSRAHASARCRLLRTVGPIPVTREAGSRLAFPAGWRQRPSSDSSLGLLVLRPSLDSWHLTSACS
jgi:hypothetical protein